MSCALALSYSSRIERDDLHLIQKEELYKTVDSFWRERGYDYWPMQMPAKKRDYDEKVG